MKKTDNCGWQLFARPASLPQTCKYKFFTILKPLQGFRKNSYKFQTKSYFTAAKNQAHEKTITIYRDFVVHNYNM